MKPSQVPNQLPHPPPRRMLPLHSPELCHRDRLGPPRHPPHPLGPICSSGFHPSSPTNISSSANRPHPTPRDRLGPLQHSAQSPAFVPSSTANRPHPTTRDRLGPLPHSAQPPAFVPNSTANRPHSTPRHRLGPPQHSTQPSGSFCPRLVPISPTHSGSTVNRPQPSPPSGFHPASPQFMKDLSNHSPSSHIRRDEVTESKVTLSYSGSKNVTAQRQESNQVFFSLF